MPPPPLPSSILATGQSISRSTSPPPSSSQPLHSTPNPVPIRSPSPPQRPSRPSASTSCSISSLVDPTPPYPTTPFANMSILLRFRLSQVLLILIQTFRTSSLTWVQTRSHGYEHRRTRTPSPSTRNQSCPRSNRSLYLFRLTSRPLVILRLLVKRAVVPV